MLKSEKFYTGFGTCENEVYTMKNKILAIATLSISGPTLAACMQNEPSVEGMANPASVYCESIGGRSVIKQEADGEAGYCHLPDGRVVEEWTLYRSA